MGKNFTLYISHLKFADEENKSGLVNRLLEKHYLSSLGAPVDSLQAGTFVPLQPDPETGYPCCTGKRPCKHWVWDSDKAVYVNALTGKAREADI